MIRNQDRLPEFYYNKSRDFQLMGRAFDIVYNYIKSNVDCEGNVPLNCNTDIKLLELLCKTIGFDTEHHYDDKDLFVLCNSFCTILKSKGTKEAICECINVLLRAQNITKKYNVDILYDYVESGVTIYRRQVEIGIPGELKDILLLEDMLDYVLPTGFTYSIYYLDMSFPEVYTYFTAKIDTPTITNYYGDEVSTIGPLDSASVPSSSSSANINTFDTLVSDLNNTLRPVPVTSTRRRSSKK